MSDASASRPWWAWAVAAGVALGVAYTLSPLTVLSLAVVGAVAAWAGRELAGRERRWFVAVVGTAVAVRLVVIAALLLTADSARPWATLFGDEEFFTERMLWLRNIGLGVPISKADFIYAVDELGHSSYVDLLAFLQALVGEAPYGIRVMNAAFHVTGVLVVYRLARAAYGGVAALVGLALLLTYPSLSIWSVSALKEPLYTLAAVGELVCALYIVRGKRWEHRALAAGGTVVGIVVLESLRRGGSAVGALGTVGGLMLGLSLARPRLLAGLILSTAIVAAAGAATPAVRAGLMSVARNSATYHAGHVQSSGYSYRILDGRYYRDRDLIANLQPGEAAAYVVRAVVSYVTEPVPWRAESFAMRAYWPEQVVWYLVLAMVPFGFAAGIRLDALFTSVVGAHAAALAMMVALTSGNIGTLIRHRGLVLPYLAWLAGLGACDLLRRAVPAAPVDRGGPEAHGHF